MTSYHDLKISFMGYPLLIAMDDGVYGENKHYNEQEAIRVREMYKDFIRPIAPVFPSQPRLSLPEQRNTILDDMPWEGANGGG